MLASLILGKVYDRKRNCIGCDRHPQFRIQSRFDGSATGFDVVDCRNNVYWMELLSLTNFNLMLLTFTTNTIFIQIENYSLSFLVYTDCGLL